MLKYVSLLLITLLPVLWAQQRVSPHAQVTSPHGKLDLACQNCHTYTSWRPIRGIPDFNHDQTKFPLRGMHQKVSCTQCHTSVVFSKVGSKCADCHADIHRRQAGAACETCHTVNGWRVSLQSIQQHLNRFPLTGSHALLECDSCHKQAAAGRFQGLSADCGSCHTSLYNKTTNPNHAANGFPNDCSICHSPNSWIPAYFDHSRTRFPLTGMHRTLPCAACHAKGNFTNVDSSCASCHMKDYSGTNNPNHKAAGFPTECYVCHTTQSWIPASFDHSRTGFPLTGAHLTIPCASCHVGGRYAGTPVDCYACHQKDYGTASNPNHVAANFPTTCAQCHGTSTWLGAVFNHTWFPIYSGTHAGKWTSCNDCHVNSANFAVFSCITCHSHDASVVVPAHSGIHGFSYTPTSCYSCHRTGQGGG